ncbi:MBL fold metallo-hydrolase [Ramlibacter sp. MMS24-I3-19]|uniref:MBL fold metallo-hydrolase n=1 Tax=Ramlibacter sp. MMS24-I3-19 TaxID=3416606 RepID=UPI003D08D4C5
MKVRFLGPVGKVTGSCTWMWDEKKGWNFLIDCGMQQGEATAAQWNRSEWPFDPGQIQFVVLTHAHVDHCGLLPALYKRGFQGRVFCTRETAALATLLLKDAAKLSDLGYAPEDVDLIQWHEPGAGQLFGKFHPAGQDLFLWFYRSAHVVGAVSVAVYWGAPKATDQRSILFSGDLGPNEEDTEALPFLRHRMGVWPHDFAVVESTYGATVRDRAQTRPTMRRQRLAQLLDRTLEDGGTLVIPAFAFGRTQDVLFDLHWLAAEYPQRYGSLPVFLDSPTARKIHRVVLNALERTESNGRKGKVRPLWMGKQMFTWFGLDGACPDDIKRALQICGETLGHRAGEGVDIRLRGNDLARSWRGIVRAPMGRAELAGALEATPGVLVLSSGTCDGGPAAHWLPKLLGDVRNTVALAGFCAPRTIGGKLLALANLPESERQRLSASLEWPDGPTLKEREVRASITRLEGYSAHADQAGLVNWTIGQSDGNPCAAGKLVFIQHGNESGRLALEQAIRARSTEVGLDIATSRPQSEEIYDLDKAGAIIDPERELREIELLLAQLEAQRKRLRG